MVVKNGRKSLDPIIEKIKDHNDDSDDDDVSPYD
jgi:hypothetical protein